jgi:hypothetical protein
MKIYSIDPLYHWWAKLADKDEELPELKALYDELWRDARTMIKDMKRSIYIYLFAGFITLVFSAIMIGTAISDWNKILTGNISTFTYLYVIAGTLGSVIYVAFGVLLLYWYNKLKNRYARLIKLEKTLRD